MKKILIATLLVLISLAAFSQQFKASSPLPVVEKDGFYRILLTPEISCYANQEFSNIRIMDEAGREVPYLFASQPSNRVVQYFREYKIEQKLQLEDSCTVLIIKNPSSKPIQNISLRIKNAEVTKDMVLYGSDDRTHWYALKEKFQLSNISSAVSTSELKIVDFPLSNYRYYKIWISDKESGPLNIINAGYYDYKTEAVKYFPVEVHDIAHADSAKKKQTFVRLNFDTLRVIDNIEWKVSGAPFYRRRGTLYTEKETVDKKGKKTRSREYLTDIELHSEYENAFELPGKKIDNILLILDNEDNPPLSFDTVICSQLNRHVTAWLMAGKSYSLKFGEESLQSASYDIEYFQKNIPAEPPLLAAGAISLKDTAIQSSESYTFFTSKSFIWGAIIAIIVLLGFMSLKLIRETGEAEKSNR
jgi:hypothetical protein